jgi:uncharacterized protein
MAYADINNLLLLSKIEFSPAEIHGIATGMLCTDQQIQPERWLKELLIDNQALSQAHSELLIKFFSIIRGSLINDDYAFNLFLPDESALLTQQAEALKQWCQGFLFGVGLAGDSVLKKLTEGRDILKDMTEFTKLDTQIDDKDENEQALTEIIEYLRVAVLLLRDELVANRMTTLH